MGRKVDTAPTGKKSQIRDQSLPGYRDDPDAVSLRTTAEDAESQPFLSGEATSSNVGHDPDEALPSYESSEAIEQTARSNAERARTVAGVIDRYNVINMPNSDRTTTSFFNKKSTSKEVSARMDARLANPEELHRYVSDYLQWVPPQPILWVSGYHYVRRHPIGRSSNSKASERERVVDFDIMLSLQRYLGDAHDPEWRRVHVAGPQDKVLRGSWRRQRAPGIRSDLEIGTRAEDDDTGDASDNPATASDLGAWCRAYSASTAPVKTFRLERRVTGLDADWLKEAARQAILETGYCGHLELRVITEDRAVDIYSEHWINRLRLKIWLRWICYLTFLWIITWPVLFFITRRWRIISVEWPFSLPWSEHDNHNNISSSNNNTTSDGRRRFATISEADWFQRHRRMLQQLALRRFKGNCDGFDDDVGGDDDGENTGNNMSAQAADRARFMVANQVSSLNPNNNNNNNNNNSNASAALSVGGHLLQSGLAAGTGDGNGVFRGLRNALRPSDQWGYDE